MDMTKIYADSDFENAVVPEGQILTYLGTDESGNVVTRYKDSQGNVGTIAGSGGNSSSSADVTLGQINAEGNFQALSFNGTEASNSGNPETIENYYGWNGVLPVPDKGIKVGEAAEYYKCASVDTTAKTWTGYKAVLTDGVYSFEETVTEGLTYGTAYTPAAGNIYDAEATVQVNKLWDGIKMPIDGLVFYASLKNNTAETGQNLELYGNTSFTSVNEIPCADFTAGGYIYAYDDQCAIGGTGTLSCWFNSKKSTDTQCIMMIGSGEGGQFNMYLRSGKVAIGSGGSEVVCGAYTAEKWHHLACTSASGKIVIYIDGVSVYEGAYSVNGSNSRIMLSEDGGEPLNGYLAGVRIYNRSLDIDEIAQLASEFTPAA